MRKDDDYDYDDDYGEGGEGWPIGAIGAFVVAAVAIGAAFVFGVLPPGGGSDDDQVATASEPGITAEPVDTSEPVDRADQSTDSDEAAPVSAEPAADPTEANDPADDADPVDSEPEAERGTEQELDDDASRTVDDADSPEVGADDRADAPVATAVDAAAEAPPTESVVNEPSYPVLPDGTPVPVLVIYDGRLITLSGVVPSEDGAAHLRTLALAFSKVPGADIASFISIDPTVPANVGVRVIEMNSIRFPEGAPTISPEHALELDRVALMMTALPQVTTLVIGHADQRGDSDVNFKLSADRSRAAADYIASQGVDPTRLSSRGAGESDLLTLNDDTAALALNRRTEFVVSGLLVNPPDAEEDSQP